MTRDFRYPLKSGLERREKILIGYYIARRCPLPLQKPPPLINSTKTRQSKKIAKKIQPKKKAESEDKKPKEKVGKDYLLIAVLSLTIVFLILGWSNFTPLNRGLYIALLISLSTTYARRHYNFTETQDIWTFS